MLMHIMANQCTKFEVSSFSLSRGILGGLKIKIRWCNDNHVPFWDMCHISGKIDIGYLSTKSDNSSFNHSWDINKDLKI